MGEAVRLGGAVRTDEGWAPLAEADTRARFGAALTAVGDDAVFVWGGTSTTPGVELDDPRAFTGTATAPCGAPERGRPVDEYELREQEAELARQQAEQQLPPGWRLGKSDHERYTTTTGHLDTYSAAAAGPDGQGTVVIALSEAAAWRALPQRIAGDLPVTEVWSPDW